MTTATKAKATRLPKHEGGGYLYRGFRLQHPENEDGTMSTDWEILEKIKHYDEPTEWIANDRFSQLWYAKQVIDAGF